MACVIEFPDLMFFASLGTRMTLYALNMLPDGRFLSSELATALVPFSFHGRNQYKAVLRMMAIFHVCVSYDLCSYLFSQNTYSVFLQDEITKQEELMGEIDRTVLRSKGTKVRDVLNIPEVLFE